jgi:hypothetical protein
MFGFGKQGGGRRMALSGLTGMVVAGGMMVAPTAAHADTQPSHFVFTATAANITNGNAEINNLATNGDAGAILFVSPNYDPGGVNYQYDNAVIGIFYDTGTGEWGIFHEDGTAVTPGAQFNVLAFPAATANAFQVSASSSNISGGALLINNPATNAKPGATLQATQVWNGGYNNHAVGVFYDSGASEQSVFNEGGAPMPTGSTYNVLVGAQAGGKTETLKGTKTNIAAAGGSAVSLGSLAATSGDSNAFILDTPNYNPKGSCTGACVYDTSQTGLSYFPNQWNVFNETQATMAPKTDFNLIYWNS